MVTADSTLTTSQISARSRCTLRKAATPGVCDQISLDVSASLCGIPFLVRRLNVKVVVCHSLCTGN